jgi:hypothetical protein
MAARHADDQELCRQLTGVCFGKVCDACEGRCPICDSRSNPTKPVRICDGCAGPERFTVFEQMDYGQLQAQQELIQQQMRMAAARHSGSTALVEDSAAASSAAIGSKDDGGFAAFNSSNTGTGLGAMSSTSVQNLSIRCIICNAPGKHQAFYCRACVLLEKDRDGCPRTKGASNRKQTSALKLRQKAQFTSAASGLFQ